MRRFPTVASILLTVAAMAGCDRAPNLRNAAPVPSTDSEARQDELPVALVSDYLAERDALGGSPPVGIGKSQRETRP